MSTDINEYLEKVTFSSEWSPTQEDLMDVFDLATKSFIIDSDSYHYRDQQKTFLNLFLKNHEIFYWSWNKFPDLRKKSLINLVSFYKNSGSYYGPKLTPEASQIILHIMSTSYDAIDKESSNIECQSLRVNLSNILKKTIDFKTNYFESKLLKNEPMADFWKRSGLENSKDPDFYSLVWSHISRGSGYTDERGTVISAASKATSIPSKIIEDLVSGGHRKNKIQLVSMIINKIESIRATYRHASGIPEQPLKEIEINQSILAKFSSSEEYDLQRMILPYLSKQDFVFAVPIASKLGLANYIDRVMKNNGWLNQ